jgi:hypothetical protein
VAREHTGPLPGEVVHVGDPGVRAEATPGSVLVSRVAGQEDAPPPVVVGDVDAGVPGAARQQRDGDVRHADCGPHQLGAARLGVVVEALPRGVVLEVE